MGGAPVGIKIKIPIEHEEENNKSECSHIQINLLQTNYGLTLIIDGHIQFAEKDEYIYHEALVHPAMALAGNLETVLIIGGGDGLALREVLKWKSVKKVYLVDIDSCVVEMGKNILQGLNCNAFSDPRVEVVIDDGRRFLENSTQKFDVIIIDSTDPTGDVNSCRLFTLSFYELVKSRLNKVLVTNAGQYGSKEFQRIYFTISKVFHYAKGYSVNVPSFGTVWGFVIASPSITYYQGNLPESLKFVNHDFIYYVNESYPIINIQEVITEEDPIEVQSFYGVPLEDEEKIIRDFNSKSYVVGVTNKRVIIGDKNSGKFTTVVPNKVRSITLNEKGIPLSTIIAFYLILLIVFEIILISIHYYLVGFLELVLVAVVGIPLSIYLAKNYTEINDTIKIPDENKEIYDTIVKVFNIK
ncbi:hypothetical protein [Acidianus brierleyi]|uniref:Polyamine aminopropyltransferase n=1 Tax=Acidianus brierleyi TaxID=41673 RepID=A0A2U9IHB9_9CREN|nr:hypothetical protein [Acidianus brierleyi]AWR95411.1 hypothetical protein DFR85_13210 [Acidianus brierleyi]